LRPYSNDGGMPRTVAAIMTALHHLRRRVSNCKTWLLSWLISGLKSIDAGSVFLVVNAKIRWASLCYQRGDFPTRRYVLRKTSGSLVPDRSDSRNHAFLAPTVVKFNQSGEWFSKSRDNHVLVGCLEADQRDPVSLGRHQMNRDLAALRPRFDVSAERDDLEGPPAAC